MRCGGRLPPRRWRVGRRSRPGGRRQPRRQSGGRGSAKQVKAVMARRSQGKPNIVVKVKQRRSKRPRKKRTPSEPRQYTIADLDRAQDRVAAAERRVDSDYTNRPHSRAGLERARRELHVIESNLR